MRSKITSQILSETPQRIRDEVKQYVNAMINDQDKQRIEEAKQKMLYAMIETLPNGRDFLECVNELLKRDAQKTAELERSEKLLQEYREVNKELTSVLSEMYLADFGGNSRTVEEAMKRALKSSVYEQRIISIIKKGLNVES